MVKSGAKLTIVAIVTLVLGLMTALVILPVADQIHTPNEITEQHAETETIELAPYLSVDMLDVRSAHIDIEIHNQQTGEIEEFRIDKEQTKHIVFSGEDITVTYHERLGSTLALVTYTYPYFFGFEPPERAVLEAVPFMFGVAMLAAVLLTLWGVYRKL